MSFQNSVMSDEKEKESFIFQTSAVSHHVSLITHHLVFALLVLVIGSLVLGAWLEFAAWDLVLEFPKSYSVCRMPYAEPLNFSVRFCVYNI